jgi:hypothetical protein
MTPHGKGQLELDPSLPFATCLAKSLARALREWHVEKTPLPDNNVK